MSSPPARSMKLRSLPWLAVLLLVVGFVAWDAQRRGAHLAALTSRPGAGLGTPAVEANSSTGYAHGQRALVLPSRAMDGYHWIMQTQAAVARGDWRVRHVDYDGGPAGRDVHWAMPFRLLLTGLAWLDHTLRGAPWGLAIEHAAVWSGPVLLAVALAIFVPWLARRFSPLAAGLAAVGTVAAFPFYVDFVAGYADHHGLVNLCAAGGVLALLTAGFEPRSARRAVIVSGVAGGIGIWISAATQVPVLIGLGGGALVLLWRERCDPAPSVWSRHPELFRHWGLAGAATCLLAWLLEYAPNHIAWRLEVNHPLYALAWLGAGEALCRLARLLRGQRTLRDLGALAGGLAAVIALPLTLSLAPETFQVAEPFLWRLHHDFIAEFETLGDFLREGGYGWESLGYLLPWLALLPAGWLACRKWVSAENRAALLLAAGPALLAMLMAWLQVRWWGLSGALLIPLAAALLRSLEQDRPNRTKSLRLAAVAGVVLLAPGLIAAVRQARDAGVDTRDDQQALAERDLAHWLRQRAGDEPVVVAGSPTVTTAFIYFGGLRGVGTLYWENNAGLHAAAQLYSARSDEEARRLVAANGITHLVVVSWDGFEGIYTRLIRRLPADAPIPADAFIARLLPAAVPPPWLRSLPWTLPFGGAQARIYEIVAEQSPAEAAAHAADAALEAGDAKAAARLLAELENFPNDLRAQTALARLRFHGNDADGFAAAIARVLALRAQAGDLPLEDHVHVVSALAMATRFDLAGPELERALPKLDARSLRRLTPATLTELLAFSAAAGLPWPDPALREEAARLLPPATDHRPAGRVSERP